MAEAWVGRREARMEEAVSLLVVAWVRLWGRHLHNKQPASNFAEYYTWRETLTIATDSLPCF